MKLSKLIAFASILLIGLSSCSDSKSSSSSEVNKEPALQNKIAINAYSFNALLKTDSMDLFSFLDYCDELGVDGVDLTGYYFPGYPAPPSDEYIYSVKKRAFELGIDICGTGVRNDFCNPDPAMRQKDIALTKEWIIVAEKLGAPALRILQGNKISEEHSWEEMAEWAAEIIIECADFGKEHGVMLELQNIKVTFLLKPLEREIHT